MEQLDDPVDESLSARGRELRRRSHEIDAASRVERPGRKHWNQRTLREITRHQPFTRAQYADALPRRIEQCKAIVRQQRPLRDDSLGKLAIRQTPFRKRCESRK